MLIGTLRCVDGGSRENVVEKVNSHAVFNLYCDHSNWRTFLNVGKLFWS